VRNRIVYHVLPVEARSTVKEVAYLSGDAPVLEEARGKLLDAQDDSNLLNAAGATPPVEPRLVVTDIAQTYKATSETRPSAGFPSKTTLLWVRLQGHSR